MKEIFKDIVGYEGLYQISSLGRVRAYAKKRDMPHGGYHLYNECFIKPHRDGGGYLFVKLCKDSKQKLPKIHRLVAEAFIPNLQKKPCINHKNSIRDDNKLENLEWVTYKENMQHAVSVGHMKGVKSNCILDEEKVKEIRSSAGKSRSSLAVFYGVHPRTIRDVLNNVTWKTYGNH